ncbi:DUF1203 domain-containing protein [Flavobacterium silvisoli]|uniref:DUF1203 domain-containing protein n=1 Tax=Flavobacterium silvisoli TaxID=2529433 RepID=UPI0029392F71|nr:DUF1203 domain-containing protein [Flavobacterium silvisoli]
MLYHLLTGQTDQSLFEKKAVTKSFNVNEVPKMFDHRVLSIRGFDKNATMIYADVIQGIDLKATLHHVFINQEIDYLHIHNAKPGCYNCMVVRVIS